MESMPGETSLQGNRNDRPARPDSSRPIKIRLLDNLVLDKVNVSGFPDACLCVRPMLEEVAMHRESETMVTTH
jgi:hypothetical protein